MQMKRLSLAMLITLMSVGCATDKSAKPMAEKPPAFAKRVEVAAYDSAPRDKSEHVDVFDDSKLAQKPFKEIGLLTCEGTVKEEGAIKQAITYRARMMGANAIIMLTENTYKEDYQWRGVFRQGHDRVRTIYRAKAVIYEAPVSH